MNEQTSAPLDDFDLPDMAVEVTTSEVKTVEDDKVTAVRMAFVGIGQGGGNMADTFWKSGYRRVLIINTTEQDFKSIECPHRLIIGEDARGAGKDQKFGAKLFEQSKEEVLSVMKQTFGKDVEQVMICVGAGGGTGGGSLRGLIKVAHEFAKTHGSKDVKVGVMVSLPAISEGSVVIANAEEITKDLIVMAKEKKITPVVFADNAKILKIFPSTTIGQKWAVINKSVCGLFDSFNVLAAQSSAHATFDPQDYKRVLASGILVYGRTVVGAPETGTELADAIRKNLKGGFLSDKFQLNTATHAASIIVAKKEVLGKVGQEAYDAGFETMQRVIGSEGLVMYQGIFENEKFNGIQLFTIVGGLS